MEFLEKYSHNCVEASNTVILSYYTFWRGKIKQLFKKSFDNFLTLTEDRENMSEKLKIEFIKRVPHAKVPTRAKSKDVAYDVYAAESCIIPPFQHKVVSTGISVNIPETHWMMIAEKSGLSSKDGLSIGGGCVDSGYEGVVGVILRNNNVWGFLMDLVSSLLAKTKLNTLLGINGEYKVVSGNKIAQLIFLPKVDVEFVEVQEFSTKSDRGESGFGSTGLQ